MLKPTAEILWGRFDKSRRCWAAFGSAFDPLLTAPLYCQLLDSLHQHGWRKQCRRDAAGARWIRRDKGHGGRRASALTIRVARSVRRVVSS